MSLYLKNKSVLQFFKAYNFSQYCHNMQRAQIKKKNVWIPYTHLSPHTEMIIFKIHAKIWICNENVAVMKSFLITIFSE